MACVICNNNLRLFSVFIMGWAGLALNVYLKLQHAHAHDHPRDQEGQWPYYHIHFGWLYLHGHCGIRIHNGSLVCVLYVI